MNIIYKYILNQQTGIPQTISMVKGSSILDFKWQIDPYNPFGFPVIWTLTPLNGKEMELRTFILQFTGDTVEEGLYYWGTSISTEGLVYHLFEIGV